MAGAQTAAAPAAATGGAPPQLDDWSALLIYHQAKVRELQPEAEKTAAAAKAARDAVNNAIERGATDLGVTNDKFRQWMSDQKTSISDIAAERDLGAKAHRAMGKLVQADLFSGAAKRDTAAEQAIWFHNGYDDGVNGRDQRADVDPIFLQNYLGGWNAGQAMLAMGLAQGAQVAESLHQPKNTAPVDLNGPEDDEEDPEDAIRRGVRKLKNDPEFMARGGDDGQGEPVDGEGDAPAAGGARKDVH